MQDGSALKDREDAATLLCTPEMRAADMLETFAAADAAALSSDAGAPPDWTIASFGVNGDAEAHAGGDRTGEALPSGYPLGIVRLSQLESDGDDASEAGSGVSELSMLPLADAAEQTCSGAPLDDALLVTNGKAAQSTPGTEAPGLRSGETDFTFSLTTGLSGGASSVSPVWGPLLPSARSVVLAGAAPAAAITALSNASASDQRPSTREYEEARLVALPSPPEPALVRRLRAAADALGGEEAFAAHVGMAQVLLAKKVPWLVITSREPLWITRCTNAHQAASAAFVHHADRNNVPGTEPVLAERLANPDAGPR